MSVNKKLLLVLFACLALVYTLARAAPLETKSTPVAAVEATKAADKDAKSTEVVQHNDDDEPSESEPQPESQDYFDDEDELNRQDEYEYVDDQVRNDDDDGQDDDGMMSIEPSEFAMADDDRTHDDEFEYGNEDDMIVYNDGHN